MKKQRVECDQCQNFIEPGLAENKNLLSAVKTKAKCKLGKRVMFRVPVFISPWDFVPINDWGYIRLCNDFKNKKDDASTGN